MTYKSSSRNKMQIRLLLITVLVTSTVSVASLTLPRYFCLAIPPSLFHKLFWVDKNKQVINRGDYVVYMHKAPFNGYRKNSVPEWKTISMVKKVGCNEGDILTVDNIKRYFCNGEYMGTAKDKALSGMQLQNFVWNGPVPPRMILPMGEHKDSYDGRYYGFILKTDVLNKAHPVFN